jgi:1-acyl-sn-glycerol-3-phosphate acyltransferase
LFKAVKHLVISKGAKFAPFFLLDRFNEPLIVELFTDLTRKPHKTQPAIMFFIDSYKTNFHRKTVLSRIFGWSRFYFHWNLFYKTFYWLYKRYKAGHADELDLVYRATWHSLELIEACGGKVHIEGMENYHGSLDPVIFVGNHMSTIETTLLPCMIMPHKKITFVLKQQLLEIPIYSSSVKIMKSIGVTRQDPIADFKKILSEGKKHIENGTSIVIFPQTTRTTKFDPKEFGSAGVKLAKRTGVPIIPFAVKTDFLKNGKIIKDIGPIDKRKTVHVKFGKPIEVEGNGREAHQKCIDFIQENLNKWQAEDDK